MIKKILRSRIFKVILVFTIIIVGLLYFLNPYKQTISWNEIGTSLPYTESVNRRDALLDLEYMLNKISKHHVSTVKGLPEEIANQYDIEVERMPDEPLVIDLWSAASRIISKLEDAHSNVLYVTDEEKRIDVHFKQVGNKTICTSGDRRGQQLLEIGGITTENLYNLFLTQFSYENIYYAEHNFPTYLTRKHLLYWLGLQVSDEVELTFLNGTNTEVEIYRFNEPPKVNPLYNTLDFVRYSVDKENKAAVLTLDSCRYNEEYIQTVKSFFKEVRGNDIKAIAIDLRNNGGGNSRVANEFIRYLPVENYVNFGSKIRVKSWLINNQVKESKNDKYEDFLYHGEVYVLTSKATFSSATMFTVMLRDNNLSKVIGEPSGNKPSAYGDLLLFQLPNSKLPFTITYKYFSRPDVTKDSEKAIFPDYLIDQNDAIKEFYRIVNQ